MNLPDYIYDKILIYILDYVTLHKRYLKTFKTALNKYNNQDNNIDSNNNYNNYNNNVTIYNKIFNHNEIINFSLVNKKWFKLVSDTLSLNLNFKNYIILDQLIDNNGINNNNNNNNNHKIINNRNNNLIKIYNGLKDYENDQSRSSSNSFLLYKKIYINGNSDDVHKIITSFREYPSNCRFNIQIPLSLLSSVYKEILENISSEDGGGKINKITIIDGSGFHEVKVNDLFKLLLKLKPKKFKNDTNNQSSHYNYSALFESSQLKSLNIGHCDHIEPIEISKINNQNSKLKSLAFYLQFHDILQAMNGIFIMETRCFNYLDYSFDLNNLHSIVDKDWQLMTETLSNNNTIKKFAIKDFCANMNCIDFGDLRGGCDDNNSNCHDDNSSNSSNVSGNKGNNNNYKNSRDTLYSAIVQTYSSIILNPNSKIETLIIEGADCLNDLFYSSLKSNSKIKNLDLYHVDPKPYFKKVLCDNQNIRNLILWYYLHEKTLNLFKKYLSNFSSLYSISIFTQNSLLDKYICFLSNLDTRNLNLKEFNFYVSIGDLYLRPHQLNKITIVNNIIVSIYYQK